MSKSFEQLGCSKINIGLAITGKREDGYHDIDSIFQSIRLSDSIYFAKHHSVVFSGGAPELPEYMQKLVTYGEENLALKALRAIQDYTGCKAGAAIHLLKRVPIQAGLGGGSSTNGGGVAAAGLVDEGQRLACFVVAAVLLTATLVAARVLKERVQGQEGGQA